MTNLSSFIRLARPQQWLKNGFVFTGLLFGHAWGDPRLVWAVIAAAAGFSLVSSAIYVVNDVIDREHDRHHPRKRSRPLAARQITVKTALVFAAALAGTGLGLAGLASLKVLLIVGGYAVMNLAYSFRLKHVVILDVFVIAAGFMLRILAGTLGVDIAPSQWLLLCGLMITLFLGFAKRRSELNALGKSGNAHRQVLNRYSAVLLDQMMMVTAACVIMTYSLYTMSPETVQIHGTHNLIYTVPFVTYAIFRYIFLLHHRGGGGDPSRDLVRDPHVLVSAIAWLAATLWMIV